MIPRMFASTTPDDDDDDDDFCITAIGRKAEGSVGCLLLVVQTPQGATSVSLVK